jgi:hypothetical protein
MLDGDQFNRKNGIDTTWASSEDQINTDGNISPAERLKINREKLEQKNKQASAALSRKNSKKHFDDKTKTLLQDEKAVPMDDINIGGFESSERLREKK